MKLIRQIAYKSSLAIIFFCKMSQGLGAPTQSPVGIQVHSIQPLEVYQRFFEGDAQDDQELFADSFLKIISTEKLEEVRRVYLDQLGKFRSIKVESEGLYTLIFEQGSTSSKLLIQDGKVTSLWFAAPYPNQDQRAIIRQQLKATEGVTSALILLNNQDVLFEHNAHVSLSVGSAFKLFVLKALIQEVEAGRRAINEVIQLSAEGRSLPSGIVQDWPLGTPVTLGTLAILMISKSDNTATDHLILALGRDTIERHVPKGMKPLLTTREAFLLKWGSRVELRAAYEDANEVERRQLLTELKDDQISAVKPNVNPISIQEIEWKASAMELCQVLWFLREQELLTLNTGLIRIEGSPWDRIAFKGGSEPGVLNYSHLLMSWGKENQSATQPKRSTVCVVATINHPSKQVDPRFTELSTRLIAQATQAVHGHLNPPKTSKPMSHSASEVDSTPEEPSSKKEKMDSKSEGLPPSSL